MDQHRLQLADGERCGGPAGAGLEKLGCECDEEGTHHGAGIDASAGRILQRLEHDSLRRPEYDGYEWKLRPYHWDISGAEANPAFGSCCVLRFKKTQPGAQHGHIWPCWALAAVC